MPRPVIDAVVDHTRLEARVGGYEAQIQKAHELDAVYDAVATLINAKPQEVALLENATVAWCHAFYALPLKAGDRVLTCEAEYAANYVAFLQRQKRDGIVIDVVPSDVSGALDLGALEERIDDRVALIATTWIPTNGGLVNPAAEIGTIARRHGIPYLLDACQAVGQMPVDVQEIGCDFLSATGRKFLRGPRGTGFLYVREAWLHKLEPAMIDHFAAPWVAKDRYQLRPDARRFETWENSYALRAGLGAALDYAMAIGLERIQDRDLASGGASPPTPAGCSRRRREGPRRDPMRDRQLYHRRLGSRSSRRRPARPEDRNRRLRPVEHTPGLRSAQPFRGAEDRAALLQHRGRDRTLYGGPEVAAALRVPSSAGLRRARSKLPSTKSNCVSDSRRPKLKPG